MELIIENNNLEELTKSELKEINGGIAFLAALGLIFLLGVAIGLNADI